MLSLDALLQSIAGRIEQDAPGGDGDHVFELAEGMRLGVRMLPADAGVVAWAEVAAAPPPGGRPDENEARAAEFLRLRLARLRREGGAVGTLTEAGALILYMRLGPETEQDWLDAVKRLLNEAEATRRFMGARAEARRTTAGALFGGMSGTFGRLA